MAQRHGTEFRKEAVRLAPTSGLTRRPKTASTTRIVEATSKHLGLNSSGTAHSQHEGRWKWPCLNASTNSTVHAADILR
jgi:hypothetical protein